MPTFLIVALLSLSLENSQAELDAAVIRAVADSYVAGGVEWSEVGIPQHRRLGIVWTYRSQVRSNFGELLRNARDDWAKDLLELNPLISEMKEITEHEAYLRVKAARTTNALQRMRPIEANSMRSAGVSPLHILELGDRIQLTTENRYVIRRQIRNGQTAISRMLELDPPGFSKDGRHAVLQGSMPGNRHSIGITFFLEEMGGLWKVLCARLVYYV